MNNSRNLQTQKTAFYILLIYIAFQLSGFLFIIPAIKQFCLGLIEATGMEAELILAGWWSAISAAIAFIGSLILISRNKNFWKVFSGEKASLGVSIGWGIIGFFLVLLGQSIGAMIEQAIGIDYGSENTEAIMKVTELAPIMILASVLFGPVLEELVFRRVVFGSLVQSQNFWVAGVISAIVFAVIHLDFSHIILYTISGFVFAFLYYKTRRLLTSIIAHMLLNGYVTLIQLNADKIQQFLDSAPK